VRLGQDVFTKGSISRETTQRAVEAFQHFREVLEQHQVARVRAVGTSALREARNRDAFLKKIAQTSGLELRTIGSEEEALLVYLAVSKKIPLEGKTAMLIDIGGGSVEVTLARNAKILATESFKMGAVRLMQVLERKRYGEKKFNLMLQEYVEAARKRFNQKLAGQKTDICVGTGGNLDALSDLKGQLLKAPDTAFVTLRELDLLIAKLQKLSTEERILKLRLRPDRADVILPAAIVLREIMKVGRASRVYVPHVGVKEGILIDMVSELLSGKPPLHRDEVMAAARQLGKKYDYDEPHAQQVARLSLDLFEKTKKLHRLGDDNRLLLEAAATVHDIGQFVNYAAHHKHSYYLITSSQIMGLSAHQVELVANIARYHRKAVPLLKHDSYRALDPKDRLLVCKLAAILRIADAMDHEHACKVKDFGAQYKRPHFSVTLRGHDDLLLEKWSLLKKCDLFEKTFKVKFSVRS
ncbi:MAG TPA: Ppx/GppA phosphatase family protein, partial [bacterium]|nr:Ppx/GppA phosphatase family protein [bacterium]